MSEPRDEDNIFQLAMADYSADPTSPVSPKLRSSLLYGAQQNPDAYAEVRANARRLGIPVAAALQDKANVAAQNKLWDSDPNGIILQAPRTATWLAEPDNAAIAHDDINVLKSLENVARNSAQLGKASLWGGLQGVAGAGQAMAPYMRWLGLDQKDKPVEEPGSLTEFYKIMAAVTAAYRDQLLGKPPPGPTVRRTHPDGTPIVAPPKPAVRNVGLLPDLDDDTTPEGRFVSQLGLVAKAQADAAMPKGETWLESGIYSGVRSLITNAPITAATIATRNPTLGIVGAGMSAGGTAYVEAEAAGKSPAVRERYATTQGALEAGTEALPIHLLVEDLVKKSGVGRMLLRQFVPEIVGEQIATATQDFDEWLTLHPDKTFNEYLAARPGAALETLVATTVGVGGTVTVTTAAEATLQAVRKNQVRNDQAALAEQQREMIDRLVQAADASLVRQRDPETFKDYVDTVTRDTPIESVFVNAQDLVDVLAQSDPETFKNNAELLQAMPGVVAQIDEALKTGGVVEIPTSELLAYTTHTDLAKNLIDHLKTDPNGMSMVEAQTWLEDQGAALEADLAKIVEQQSANDGFESEVVTIRQAIRHQLDQVNRFTPDVNEVYAAFQAGIYANMAARTGLTPAQLFELRPTTIRSTPLTGDELQSPAKAMLGFRDDNPGGDWLERKQARAEEDMTRAAERGDSQGLGARGLHGSITGWFRDHPQLPVEELAKLEGVNQEQRFAGDKGQYDWLKEAVDANPSGFDPKSFPILVGVNHKGEAFIIEGNTRVAVARDMGVDRIAVEVRYFNGGEQAQGPFSPDAVGAMTELQQFAGQRSMTSNPVSLQRAMSRVALGEDPDLVRRETGWFQGKDGQWRYEISDQEAKLVGQVSDYPVGWKGRYADILHHPTLYTAYPGMADVEVEAFDPADYNLDQNVTGGVAMRPSDRAPVVLFNARTPPSKTDLERMLLHEAAHLIQRFEGFALGASDAPGALRGTEYEKALRTYEAAGLTPKAAGAIVYAHSLGEIEARDVEARRNMTDAERRATPPKSMTVDHPIVAFTFGDDINVVLQVPPTLLGDQEFEQSGTPGFTTWFGDSQVKHEDGTPRVVYHGAKRGDRIDEVGGFTPERATSGPMPYFTESPEIASNYASGKQDTSYEVEDYVDLFRVQGRSLRAAWFALPLRTRQAIRDRGHLLYHDDTGFHLAADEASIPPDASQFGRDTWLHYLNQENRGNGLLALHDVWVASGSIFGEEQDLRQAMRLMGVEQVTYEDPYAEHPSVFPVYLSIQTPLDVSTHLPPTVMAALREAAATAPQPEFESGVDSWDKRAMPPELWLEILEKAQASEDPGREFAWTVVPDWATAVLAQQGYDGLVDRGGKMGGEQHVVWVPFRSQQVKSVFNRGAFSPDSTDLLYQDSFYQGYEPGPNLKSALYELIGAKGQPRASTDQWRALIANNGVKKEEVEWLGLEEWLRTFEQEGANAKPVVTKEQMLQFVAENGVHLTEVVLGGDSNGPDYDSMYEDPEYQRLVNEYTEENFRRWYDEPDLQVVYGVRDRNDPRYIAELELPEEGEPEVDVAAFRDPDQRDFRDSLVGIEAGFNVPHMAGGQVGWWVVDDNTTSGGVSRLATNDRFVSEDDATADLDTIRQEHRDNAWDEYTQDIDEDAERRAEEQWREDNEPQARTQYSGYVLPGGSNYREVLITMPEEDNPPVKHTYREPHFTEHENIIAHFRVTDRMDDEGRYHLHLQETQSQLHQEGRTSGYKVPPTPQRVDEVTRALEAAKQTYRALLEQALTPALPALRTWHADLVRALPDLEEAKQEGWRLFNNMDSTERGQALQAARGAASDRINQAYEDMVAARTALGQLTRQADSDRFRETPGEGPSVTEAEVQAARDRYDAAVQARQEAAFARDEADNAYNAYRAEVRKQRDEMNYAWSDARDAEELLRTLLDADNVDAESLLLTVDRLQSLQRERMVRSNRLDTAEPSEAETDAATALEALRSNEPLRAAQRQLENTTYDFRQLYRLRGQPNFPFKGDAWATLVLKRVITMAVNEGSDAVSWIIGNQQNGSSTAGGQWFYDRNLVNEANKLLKKYKTKVELMPFKGIGGRISTGKTREEIDAEYAPQFADAQERLATKVAEVNELGVKPEMSRLAGQIEDLQRQADAILTADPTATAHKDQDGTPGFEEGAVLHFDEALANLHQATMKLRELRGVQDHIAALANEKNAALSQNYQWGFEITPELRAAVQDGFTLFQGAGGKMPTGARGSYNPQSQAISLLQNADLSTFLHESAHFWIETLAFLADRADAPQQIKDDWATAANFMGWGNTEPGAWLSIPVSDRRKGHEKWAETFERYLREGQAPSPAMRGMFQRFRSWLVNIYKTVTGLGVEVDPEIKQVFDRLLASDEEIAAAEAGRNFAPIFNTKPDKMTDREWENYQRTAADATATALDQLAARSIRDMTWVTNTRERVKRGLRADQREKRKAVRAEVQAEVQAEPVYAAIRFLRMGQTADGEAFEGPGHKLSAEAVAAIYADIDPALQDWRKLGFGRFGMLTNDATTGLHPDDVAGMFGFSSGHELVEAIRTAQPMKERVAAKATERALERYGDLVDQDAIDRAADEAIHNDVRLRFVETEASALAKATGKVKVLASAARQYASQLIARTKVRDLKPGRFTGAETRAAGAAAKAAAKGDLVLAATEKRNQLLNAHAARAAFDAQAEVEKIVRYFTKLQSPAAQKRLEPSYRTQINQLLERFDLRTGQTLKAIDKRKSLAAWVDQMKAQGLEPIIDEQLLNEAYQVHYRDMTVEELRGLYDAIRNIHHLSRLKSKLLKAADRRRFDAVVQESVETIEANAYKTNVEKLEHDGLLDRVGSAIESFFAIHRKFASLIREMSGSKDGGILWRAFIQPMNEAHDQEASMREAAAVELLGLYQPVLRASRDQRSKRFIPEIGNSLSLDGRLAVALNWGNETNRARIMDGDNWTADQVAAILQTLTAEQLQFVNDIWAYLDSYWPLIEAKEMRVTGVAPQKVQASPFQVMSADGQLVDMTGGYYPIKYDTKRSSKAEADELSEPMVNTKRGLYSRATTRRGHTKARVETVKRPVRKDLMVPFAHVNEVIHDLAFHEYLIDANRLLLDPRIDRAIRTHYSPEVLRAMKETLKDIAEGEIGAQNGLEQVVNHIRTGATVAGLGWNMMTALLQFTGLGQSLVRIGPKYLMKGVANGLGNAVKLENVAAQVFEKSEFMRLRNKTWLREVSEVQNQVRAKPLPLLGWSPGASRVITTSFFYPIQLMQMFVDLPTWMGAYDKAKAQGQDETTAVALADQAVRDSQGAGQVGDLAGVQRGNVWMKLWTNFYSFLNVGMNQLSESVASTRRQGWTPKATAALASDVFWVAFFPAAMAYTVKYAIQSALGGDDDDDEGFWAGLVKSELSYLMGFFIGLRDIGGIISSDGRGGGPPGIRLLTQDLPRLYTQVQQGELDDALRRAVVNTGGVVLHYPAGQVNRSIDGMEALANGETQNPLAVVFGPPKKK